MNPTSISHRITFITFINSNFHLHKERISSTIRVRVLIVVSCLQLSSIQGLVDSWTSLLHFLLSLVFFNRSLNDIPVHSSMLFIHRILGVPCFLAPGVVPSMISLFRHSPSFLMTCSSLSKIW